MIYFAIIIKINGFDVCIHNLGPKIGLIKYREKTCQWLKRITINLSSIAMQMLYQSSNITSNQFVHSISISIRLESLQFIIAPYAYEI